MPDNPDSPLFKFVKSFYRGQIYVYLITTLICGALIGFSEGKTPEPPNPLEKSEIDIQGHRGARGLYPENSLVGFIEAIKMGVNTLEMDVVVTKDNKVVVSHEPWISHHICTKRNGEELTGNAQGLKIYEMTLGDLDKFDCGTKKNEEFPDQDNMNHQKPPLSLALQQAKGYCMKIDREDLRFNIEIKSKPEWDKKMTPEPKEFAELVYEEVKKAELLDRTCIQSFDIRPLKILHEKDPNLTLALLVDNMKSLEKNIEALGFRPDIYSPYHELVTEELVKKAHKLKMKVIPWTINDEAQMSSLMEKGVDGIITDYPDRALSLVNE